MTRLPWQHSRSRTKSGNEKISPSYPHDWFSRSTAEPSRQAVTDLVKAHNRVKSDESNGSRSRSRPRPSTVTSSHSRRRHSRSRLSGDEAWSRSSSQCAHENSTLSSFERTDGSGKVLLSKGGGLLRRTSSILSLSSATSSSTHGRTSPPRSSRASSAASRNDDLRCRISPPFDFQHITHTEDTQFTGLGRIDESALADQFVAATTKQSGHTGLRGIAVSDIPTSVAQEQRRPGSSDNVACVTDVLSADLPQTPPRPSPPPKDEKTADHLLSDQCFEPAGLMWLAAHTEQLTDDHGSRNGVAHPNLESKPLPELPVVHAITTDDNTAREMIASPLPSPPLPTSSLTDTVTITPVESLLQRSSITLRSQNLYPTTKSSMPNLLAVQHSLTAPKGLSRHHSDISLSQQARNAPATASTRTSTSFAAIDTMNWEDAVDEAWEDADDEISSSQLENTHLEVAPIESAASTPLMMISTCSGPAKSPNRVSSSNNLEVHQLESVQEDEPTIDLTGLGISSCPASGTTSTIPRISRSSSINFSKRRSSLSYHPNDILTRSSSQESFIYSIASSKGGTQRSSNSSVSLDLINMYGGHGEDCSHGAHSEHDDKHTGIARPESGCLPPDILDQISQFGAALAADQASRTEYIPPVPPLPQHAHHKSISKVSVPERRSSIVATSNSTPSRKRASTWGNRPRQSSHTSYSLFPSAQVVSSGTPVTT